MNQMNDNTMQNVQVITAEFHLSTHQCMYVHNLNAMQVQTNLFQSVYTS